MKTAVAWLALCGTLAGLAAARAQRAAPPHAEAARLIDEGRPEEALELLRGWLRRNPGDAEGLLLRSTARFMSGDTAAGAADLDRALELDPDLRQGWLNRGALALAENDYDGALEAFSQAERIDPAAADNGLNIGAVLLLRGDVAAATERFRAYLEAHPGSAEAYYLVASNYAMTGLVQPATQALAYAIQIDEKSRRRARVDPNFSDVARDSRFQELLDTDGYRPPAGSLSAGRDFDAGFTGPDSRILKAVIRAFEVTGEPFDRQVEVASQWALIWGGRFRVKVSRRELAVTRVEMTAPPGAFSPGQWRDASTGFLRAVTVELLKLSKSAQPPGG